MTRRYLFLAVSLVVCVGLATLMNLPAVMAGNTPPDVGEKPESQLKFSHKFHIKDAAVECATCHPAAATSKLSSDNLASTHDQC